MADKEIPKQNYDIVFKAMTEQFGQKALDFYGIHTAPIVKAEPTDLPTISVNERRMDFAFSLEDGTYLHLEFQTTYKPADLDRFKFYDAALYLQKQRPIHTYVIYGADVEKADEALDHGSIQYYTKAIYMKSFNGDEIFDKLANKVQNQGTLTDEEQLQLIFLPLMQTRKERTDLATDVVDLSNKLRDEKQRFRLTGTVIGIADKFLDDSYVDKMMEVFKMTRIFRRVYEEAQQEGKQEGIQEGNIKGKHEAIFIQLESRFCLGSPDIQEKINHISDIDVLNSLLGKISKAETAEQAESLVNEASHQQSVS